MRGVRGVRACLCVLTVGQALETPCSSYKFMHFFGGKIRKAHLQRAWLPAANARDPILLYQLSR